MLIVFDNHEAVAHRRPDCLVAGFPVNVQVLDRLEALHGCMSCFVELVVYFAVE